MDAERATARKLLIVAERDGDTVSPERGVYLMDLSQTVTRDELRARVKANLDGEQALRAKGKRLFAPIAADVSAVVADASVAAHLRLREDALRLRLEAHHAARATSSRPRICFDTYKSFGYDAGVPVVRSARTALGGQTANVVATLKGTVNPELDLRRQQPLRLGRHRPWRRRRYVRHRGAARDGARSWRATRSRRRSSSPRSPAKKPACSAAASSCAARSPTS